MDNERWHGDEALRIHPVKQLPPGLVRPGAAAEELGGGEPRQARLGEERPLGIAVHDELPLVVVAGPEAAGERVEGGHVSVGDEAVKEEALDGWGVEPEDVEEGER